MGRDVSRIVARHGRRPECEHPSDSGSQLPGSTDRSERRSVARRPVVVALHRAHAVSGVRVAGARLAHLPEPHFPWRPLVVGAGVTKERLAATALAGAPGLEVVSWEPGTVPLTRVLMVRDALRGMGATVVVPNDLPHGFIAAALDAHRGVRCLALCHGNDLLNLDLYRRCLPLADAVCAVNNEILEIVSRYAPAGVALEALVCGLPVPPAPVALAVPLPPARAIRLLYAGWLDNVNKRVLDLAALCDALHDLGVGFELTVAGDGPVRAELCERLGPHIAAGRARVLGPVPQGDMEPLYRTCDLLVLVSRAEGAPLVVMEAMGAGRAVAVTSGCGGAVHAVLDAGAGVVVHTGDMAGLAAKIACLSGNGGELERMGRAAHAWAREHFDISALAPRYDALVRAASTHGSALDGGARHSGVERRWGEILGALEMLGPCDPSPLAREWAVDLGVPEEWMRARELPGLLGPADELLLGAVATLKDRGCRRIALYGAGRHTRRVERAVRRAGAIVAIADDRAGQDGGPAAELFGLPVVVPERLGQYGVDGVIVSSDEHEGAMLARALGWAGSVPVVGLYGS